MKQGYYSIIQYCPDFTRLEVCNLGVLLFCPELRFLDVKMSSRYQSRINTIFGLKQNTDAIRFYVDRFATFVRNEWKDVKGVDELKQNITRLANNFIVTQPRSIGVIEPARKELDILFNEIFGGEKQKNVSRKQAIDEQLLKSIQKQLGSEWQNKIAINLPRIPVPGFEQRTIKPVFGFKNGIFNLVLAERIDTGNLLSKIGSNLIIGCKISETENERWGQQRLNLFFESDDAKVFRHIEENRTLFEEKKIKVYTAIEPLIIEVSKSAKSLPEDLMQYAV